jgi:hypothetical protein
MWQRLSENIHRAASGRVALAALVIFLLFGALVLPGQAALAEADGRGAGSPDTSFFYAAADLYELAEAYGADGRQAYIRSRFTFDLVFPLVYVFFLTAGISWLYRRAWAEDSLWQRANLAPLLGGLFDYLENGSTSLVMARYPAQTAVVDTLAGVFTLAKWLFVGGSFALLLVGVGAALWRWLRTRNM